jgi:transcriptional regulator with XRE-family HTH domain
MRDVPRLVGVRWSSDDLKLLADFILQARQRDLIFAAIDTLLYPPNSQNASLRRKARRRHGCAPRLSYWKSEALPGPTWRSDDWPANTTFTVFCAWRRFLIAVLTPSARQNHAFICPMAHDDLSDRGADSVSVNQRWDHSTMQETKSSASMTAQTLRKIANRETNEVDKFVGERIRLYRAMLGMSQQKLAETLGVTFQQLHKYERGENRIGAGRLLMVATALGIPISFLLDEEGFSQRHGTGQTADLEAPETARDAYSIGRAFSQITDPEIRRSITTLVQSLARPSEMDEI